MLIFEHPCYERIRTFLRIESIFNRTIFFASQTNNASNYAALLGIFELLEMTSRSDLKAEVLHELNRQKQYMQSEGVQQMSREDFYQILNDVNQATSAIQQIPGRIGQQLRDNEWLMMVKSRTALPGGACAFDLPSLYYWLQQSNEKISAELQSWLNIFSAMISGITQILKILRLKVNFTDVFTVRGVYLVTQFMNSLGLIRVQINHEEKIIPEISASRSAVSIHFVDAEPKLARPKIRLIESKFKIALCHL